MACFIQKNKAIILINSGISEDNDTVHIPDFIQGLEEMGEITEIIVKINSGGGSVTLGYAIFLGLVTSSKIVTCELCGICASIAAIIFLAGTYRKAVNYGLYMLHEAAGGDEKSLNMINQSIQKILTPEGFGNLIEIMADETWYTADELLEMGIIDEIFIVAKGEILENNNNTEQNMEETQKEMQAKKVYNFSNSFLNKEYKKEITEFKEDVKAIKKMENKSKNAKAEEDPEEDPAEETVESLREKLKAMEEEKESLKKAKADEEEIDSLKASIEALAKENDDLKSSIKNKTEEEEKKAKMHILIKNGVAKELHNAWLEQPLETINKLVKTVNKKSPEINFSVDAKASVGDFKNMTSEQKIEMYNSQPEQYAQLFLTALKK